MNWFNELCGLYYRKGNCIEQSTFNSNRVRPRGLSLLKSTGAYPVIFNKLRKVAKKGLQIVAWFNGAIVLFTMSMRSRRTFLWKRRSLAPVFVESPPHNVNLFSANMNHAEKPIMGDIERIDALNQCRNYEADK